MVPINAFVNLITCVIISNHFHLLEQTLREMGIRFRETILALGGGKLPNEVMQHKENYVFCNLLGLVILFECIKYLENMVMFRLRMHKAKNHCLFV